MTVNDLPGNSPLSRILRTGNSGTGSNYIFNSEIAEYSFASSSSDDDSTDIK